MWGAEPYVCGSRARATEIRQEEGRCDALMYGRGGVGGRPERLQTQCPLPRDGVKGGESEGAGVAGRGSRSTTVRTRRVQT